MSWIPTSVFVPLPGRFAHAQLVGPHDPQRAGVEAFIAAVYRDRYGAQLHSFLPHLLAYYDLAGTLVAAVGLRLGSEGPLFVEQYLDLPAEVAIAQRLDCHGVWRQAMAEVGNFAAATPGAARELIVQVTCLLNSAQVRWVLFAATRQLRNAFERLQLSPVELVEARPERLAGSQTDWGRYYDANPVVVCGNVATGHAYLMQRLQPELEASAPAALCLAGGL